MSRWLPMSLLWALSLAACGDPSATTDSRWLDALPLFDASVPDGGVAAERAACVSEAPRFNNNFSPFLGGTSSVDVEVVLFSSFYCGYCADFYAYSHALWKVRGDFRERARIYYHHANLGYRHRAAVAAMNQGGSHFWSLHDYIFDGVIAGRAPSDERIREFAEKELALDMQRFDADVASEETVAFLRWEVEQGWASGMTATPTVFVCGEEVTWTELEGHVADEL